MSIHPLLAVGSFFFLFIVATFLFVPPEILMFAAGFGFAHMLGLGYGIAVAMGVSLVGSAVGAILAFLRARYMMRDLILLFVRRYPIVKACDQAFHRNGFRVMLLLRLW